MDIRWRDILAMRPPTMNWQNNLRLLAPVLLALVGFSLAGQFINGLLVALGAYIVLFGGGQPGRLRLKVYLIASGFMLASTSLGVLAAGAFPLTILAYLLVALAAVAADVVLELGSPGPYFFVLMVGAGYTLAQGGVPLEAILPYMAIGNGLAIIFAMADVLYDRYGVERRTIADADRAVKALEHAVEPAANDRQEIESRLADAATAIHRAWSAFIAGAGQADNPKARAVEQELRQVHRTYRALYLSIVERRLLPGSATSPSPGATAEIPDRMEPIGSNDVRHSAVGEPSVGYRLDTEMTWPSVTLITLVRIGVGLVLATTITRLLGDQHSFWATLVVVLVLSYPGSQKRLTLRAIQRFLGTVVGIGVFAGLLTIPLNQIAYVALLCVLLLAISRITARNYLYGSIFITILALYITLPLVSDQTPLSIAVNRWVDTLISVLIALAMIRFIGPQYTAALVKASIRRISRASLAVLDRVLSRQDFIDPSFVEDRRRLQYSLVHSGRATEMATPSTAARAAPYASLEHACARLGYVILGISWSTAADAELEQLAQARQRYGEIAAIRLEDPSTAEYYAELADAVSNIFEHTGQV